jgi:hypothetical protein
VRSLFLFLRYTTDELPLDEVVPNVAAVFCAVAKVVVPVIAMSVALVFKPYVVALAPTLWVSVGAGLTPMSVGGVISTVRGILLPAAGVMNLAGNWKELGQCCLFRNERVELLTVDHLSSLISETDENSHAILSPRYL